MPSSEAGGTVPHRRFPRGGTRRRGPTVVEERGARKAVAAAAIGNTMEWYDFGVYSYVAVIVSRVFFPAGNPTAQLLSTFAAFAVAFLVRPLGGFFFGPLGDRIGRRRVLAVTMLTMAAGTLGIGVIPSYASIGIWAPVLLLVARLVQGFSTGGEYGGATTFVAEYSPDRRRGFMASWLEFGTLTGYSLGAAVALGLTVGLPEESLLSWGWRIPFLVAGPLGVIGLYLRFRLEETPAFQEGGGAGTSRPGAGTSLHNLAEVFRSQRGALLTCVGLVLVFNVTNYMLTAYMPTYLSTVLGLPRPRALLLVLVTMVVIMGIVVVLGRYSDRVGRLPIVGAGCVALLVLSLPVFLLMGVGTTAAVLGALLLLGLILICFSSTLPATLPALFATRTRYSGVAVGYNISVAAFGGTTPLIAEALVAGTGYRQVPAALLMVAGLVGLVAVYFTRESSNRPLPGSPPMTSDRHDG